MLLLPLLWIIGVVLWLLGALGDAPLPLIMLLKHDLRLSVEHPVVVALHEGPALDALCLARILRVLENLLLLLLGAVKVFVLLPVLWDSITRRGHLKAPTAHLVPIHVLEKWMALDLSSATRTCTEPLARVPVEQVHDEILSLLGHAYGQLENATLYVIEKLVPRFKFINCSSQNEQQKVKKS